MSTAILAAEATAHNGLLPKRQRQGDRKVEWFKSKDTRGAWPCAAIQKQLQPLACWRRAVLDLGWRPAPGGVERDSSAAVAGRGELGMLPVTRSPSARRPSPAFSGRLAREDVCEGGAELLHSPAGGRQGRSVRAPEGCVSRGARHRQQGRCVSRCAAAAAPHTGPLPPSGWTSRRPMLLGGGAMIQGGAQVAQD